MRTVAVFFGGNSNEYAVSLITGIYCANLLRTAGYAVLPVLLGVEGGIYDCRKAKGIEDFAKNKFPELFFAEGGFCRRHAKRKAEIAVDCALVCCHGGMGEDGTLAALLDYYRIPTASPKTPPSALFMNKAFSQIAARGLHIPVLPSVRITEEEREEAEELVKTLGYPLIVKPCVLGSSIGISVARDGEELKDGLKKAFALDHAAVVEEYLAEKRDFNCAAYRDKDGLHLSEVEEVFSAGEILSFEDKYVGGARKAEFPAKIPKEISDRIKEYTEKIYNEFDLSGIVRADFLMSGEEVYFNELNTVPGSLACYLFGKSLLSQRCLLVRLIEEGMRRRGERKEISTPDLPDLAKFSRGKGCKNRLFGV